MVFAQTKILWGFVEKSGIRMPDYEVFIRRDGQLISTTTNNTGFFQLNLGNFGAGFSNGDIVYVESIGESQFYGQSYIVLSGGTASQQVGTISVTQDVDPPLITTTPEGFINQSLAHLTVDIFDSLSGPDSSTLNISENGVPVISNGNATNYHYAAEFSLPSPNIITVVLKPIVPYAHGTHRDFIVTISDKIGNETNHFFEFDVDLIPPSIFSFAPPINSFVATGVAIISIALGDSLSGINPESIELVINDIVYNVHSPEIAWDGGILTHTPASPYQNASIVSWNLVVADNAGNRTERISSCFAVLSTGPQITQLFPEANSAINDARTIVRAAFFNSGAPIDLSTFSLIIDGVLIPNNDSRLVLSSSGFVFSPTADFGGEILIESEISDSLGVQSHVEWSFLIDKIGPISEILRPQTGQYLPSTMSGLQIRLTDNESGIDETTISVVINGVVYTVATPGVNFANGILNLIPTTPHFVEAANEASLMVSDRAGNSITSSFEFFVDASAPEIIDVHPRPDSFIGNLNQPIEIRIRDTGSGIWPASIKVKANLSEYNFGDTAMLFNGELIRITPYSPYNPSDTIIVQLEVSDNVGHVLKTVVTSFRFDLSPLQVISSHPNDQDFVAVIPESFSIVFNKPIDISQAVVGTDVILESKSSTNPYVPAPLAQVVIDQFSPETLTITPVQPFAYGTRYRVQLTNNVRDIGGNRLYPEFTSEFTVYHPGDLMVRGAVGISDIYKYALVVDRCEREIVAAMSEIVDLNGDSVVNEEDLTTLENFVLDSSQNLVVSGAKKIQNITEVVTAGVCTGVSFSGFETKSIGEKVVGAITLAGTQNLRGFQADIAFDPTILKLIDIQPTVENSQLRYRIMSPGVCRIIVYNLESDLVADILQFKFRVIGSPGSSIAATNIEIVAFDQGLVPPQNVQQTNFITNTVSRLVSGIGISIQNTQIPDSVRETIVNARLLDAAGTQIVADGLPMNWTVIGNGFVYQGQTETNSSGTSKNTVHLSGPVNSIVRVRVELAYDVQVSATSSDIILYDSHIAGIRVQTGKDTATTGESIKLTVFARTVDGLEFSTSDVLWTIDNPNAVVSQTGEFVAFAKGSYRVTATLKSDASFVARSAIIEITSALELFDCEDRMLPPDPHTGFSKLDLGRILAGEISGTQEIRIRNTVPNSLMKIDGEVLLDVATLPFPLVLITEFSPIIEGTFSLSKRSSSGIPQIMSLVNGTHSMVVQKILASNAINGVATLYLDHVLVSDVGIFGCGPHSCIGRSAGVAFKFEKDTLTDLLVDGDYFVDKMKGKISVKVSRDMDFSTRIEYRFLSVGNIDYDAGRLTLNDTRIFVIGDAVVGNYTCRFGRLDNLMVQVSSTPDVDVEVSSDGISFGNIAEMGSLLPRGMARLYVRAQSNFGDMIGNKSVNLMVEADLLTIKS